MQTVTVPALTNFEYDGHRVVTHELLTVSPLQAAILARQGLVSLLSGVSDGPVTPVAAVAPAPPVETQQSKQTKTKAARKRGGYRRRDMRAAD